MMNVLLRGLTRLESAEFHLLDASMPFEGNPVWHGSLNIWESAAERRWLELWKKHLAALNDMETMIPSLPAAPEFTHEPSEV